MVHQHLWSSKNHRNNGSEQNTALIKIITYRTYEEIKHQIHSKLCFRGQKGRA